MKYIERLFQINSCRYNPPSSPLHCCLLNATQAHEPVGTRHSYLEAVLDNSTMKQLGFTFDNLAGVLAIDLEPFELNFGSDVYLSEELTNHDLVIMALRKIDQITTPFLGPVEEEGKQFLLPLDRSVLYNAEVASKAQWQAAHSGVPYYKFNLGLDLAEYDFLKSLDLHRTVLRIKNFAARHRA